MKCELIEINDYRHLIDEWKAQLPAPVRALMNNDDLAGNLNFLISDDAPQMIVTAEEKHIGVFEVHLFCERKANRQTLTAGMAAVKTALFEFVFVDKLIFTILSRQRILKECLAMNGCVWTGWKYLEKKLTFEHWVLEKELNFLRE